MLVKEIGSLRAACLLIEVWDIGNSFRGNSSWPSGLILMSAVSSGKIDGFESEDESEIDFDLAILGVWEETLSFSKFKVSVILVSS